MRAEGVGPNNGTLGLFLVSVLVLFLELLLIRWVATEVNIFAYLQNTVLVVCFMGLGMGCMTSRQPIVMRNLLMPLFILTVLLSLPFTRRLFATTSLLLSVVGDLVVWHGIMVGSPGKAILALSVGLVCTFSLMYLIWGIFVPAGRILGRLVEDHPQTIVAYSVNIVGSLAGIWLFVLLSVLYQPPRIWFLVVTLLLIPFLGTSGMDRRVNILLLIGVLVFSLLAGSENPSLEVLWSPYQKLSIIDIRKVSSPTVASPFVTSLVTVNNTLYQWILDLNKERVHSFSQATGHAREGISQYDIPFLLHANPRSSLIVGAGTGNDAAGALRNGVAEVTAVEIDPAIIYLGLKYHPEKPYQSPKVRVVNDDARSFFMNTRSQYDVISFGLLDSHTTAAMTNARLDHYVYTWESLEKSKSLLAPGGILVLTFEAQKPYIADRIARGLRDLFREEPLAFRIPFGIYGLGGVMFVAGDLEGVRRQIESNRKLSDLIAEWQAQNPLMFTYKTEITTDDWPYLYLRSREIPLLYYFLAVLMFFLFIYAKWRLKLEGLMVQWDRSQWHFFFLGAAFLLLEVQNISKAAVVLGNTWLVNAVIISGILVMILLANLIVSWVPRVPLLPVFVLLIGSCVALYFVDIAQFAGLPYYQKAAIVGGLTTFPVLFSGVIFIRSFSAAKGKDVALGANLIGSLVGGLLQSVTFITGIKALLLIVAGLYLFAMLCSLRMKEIAA